MNRYLLLLTVLLLAFSTKAQVLDSSKTTEQLVPEKYIGYVDEKLSKVSNRVESVSEKYLARWQKKEARLRKKLQKIDSSAAARVFGDAEKQLKTLEQKIAGDQSVGQYIPYYDSLKTALLFLQNQAGRLSANSGRLGNALQQVKKLDAELQKAENIKQYLKDRKALLQANLEKFGFAKQLKSLNKEAYYYAQQINEYKEALHNPQKLEQKALDILRRTKFFKEFMQKNSMLATLFPMPATDPLDPNYAAIFSGLQTRTQVQQLVQGRISAGGPNAVQSIQQNIQEAQNMLQTLKQRATQLGNAGNEMDTKDFKPNTQKTKSFKERIELGTNFQNTGSNNFLPSTSDLGLSLGFRINDKSIVGVGASYKLGWGKNIRNIKFTHEGIGIRSFLDWKLKGSFFISGGYEQNYRTRFDNLQLLRANPNYWQTSGLLGISKIVSMNNKWLKKTKVQLYYDFMYKQNIPVTQPVLFRFGYGF